MKREGAFPIIRDLRFHVEDEQGRVVATTQEVAEKNGPVLEKSDRTIHRGMNQSFEYIFVPLDETKKHTFVLDGIVIHEQSDASVTFDPKTLDKKPVSLVYRNHTITLTGFSTKRNKDGQGQIGLIKLEGKLSTSLLPTFVISDRKGNGYVIDDVAFWLEAHEKPNQMDKGIFSAQLPFSGLEQTPEELTLSLQFINTLYDNVDWKLPIPNN
jgi:hypothetical protein